MHKNQPAITVEKSGAEYFAAVPKKVEKIVDLFKDMIPMG